MSRWIRRHGPAVMLLSLAAMLAAMALLLRTARADAGASSDRLPSSVRIWTDENGTARMDCYYPVGSVREREDVPARDMYGNGLRWRLEEVAGPVETEYGDCWKARYVRLEYE